MSGNSVELKNPNLETMTSDYLYHLGISIDDTKSPEYIRKQFGDIKVVCVGGTMERMRKLANHLYEIIFKEECKELVDLCKEAQRYSMFKVGPVLCVSHGIGMSSFSVLLHELFKLVKYANCIDPIFIRVGSSGGLGIDAGTVVVTQNAFNGYLKNEYELAILGERVCRPAKFDGNVANELAKCSMASDNFKTEIGSTMGTECFYEGQGRLDGAICHYQLAEKMNFLNKCYSLGIKNIEMEAPMFAALTHHLNIKAADVCVTFLNRLNGDQVTITAEQKADYEHRPLIIVGRFVEKLLEGIIQFN